MTFCMCFWPISWAWLFKLILSFKSILGGSGPLGYTFGVALGDKILVYGVLATYYNFWADGETAGLAFWIKGLLDPMTPGTPIEIGLGGIFSSGLICGFGRSTDAEEGVAAVDGLFEGSINLSFLTGDFPMLNISFFILFWASLL